jgi:poly(3-hydroxybutyrate) depolymerase
MAYVPADCRSQPGCFVHVVFHGCKQGLAAVGDKFVKGAGFARWAESNRLILLFPQVRSGSFNPNGCWDWWGYSGRNFLERDAPQMTAVKRMIEALAAAP